MTPTYLVVGSPGLIKRTPSPFKAANIFVFSSPKKVPLPLSFS